MGKYLIRVRIVLVISAITLSLLTFFGVYKPLVSEVENKAIAQFKLVAVAKTNAFKATIDKNIQAAMGLSSRSAIRDKIVEYKNGEVDIEALSAYSESKYRDGASVVENLTYAKRVVDQQVVTSYFNETYSGVAVPNSRDVDALVYAYTQKEDVACLDVISPIAADDVIVGYDFVGFCLNETIEQMNDDSSIWFELTKALPEVERSNKDSNLYEDGEFIFYIYFLDEENIVMVYQSKKNLYQSRDSLSRLVLFNMGFGYGVIILLIYVFIFRYARLEMEGLTIDRDVYKQKADFDGLTGAYSRQFLENFLENHPYEEGTLLLIDLDNFKQINDKYGHLIGDEVLKSFVVSINQVIQSEDLVVRYGGDEFVVLLRDSSIETGEEVVSNVMKSLSKTTNFEFEIDFSYGISIVQNMVLLYEHINEADMKMYLHKMDKRIKKEPL